MDIGDEKKPVEIFCCYAHEDQLLMGALKKHLKLWERQSLIAIWTDTDITPGTHWEKEITRHLNSAHIILFLVSPDFLASDYCYSIEMKYAMERYERGEVNVIPIILRHCAWQEAPFGKLQALPTYARPIISSEWDNQDEAFVDIAKSLRSKITTISLELSIGKRLINREQNVNEMPLKSQKTTLSGEKERFSSISSPDYIGTSSVSRRPYRKLFIAIACFLIVMIISGSLFWIFQPSHLTKLTKREVQHRPSATSGVISSHTPTVTPHASKPTASPFPTLTQPTANVPNLSPAGLPLLTVNQSSVNANTDCSYTVNSGWTCPLLLHNSQNTQQILGWTASTQFPDVIGFSQISGTLNPGQAVSINVSVSNISCPGTRSFSFLGPNNKVIVIWHCASPTLTVNVTDLNNELNGCTVTNNTYQCSDYLGLSLDSQGGLNWSSSGSEQLCDVNGCSTGPVSGNAITPSKGSIMSSANSEQITIVVPICQHQTIKDTIIFSGPNNSVTVTYSCNSSS